MSQNQMNRFSPITQTERTPDCIANSTFYYSSLLRRFREYNATTQERIADQSGLYLSHISTLENGAAQFSIDKLDLICNAQAINQGWVSSQVDVYQQIVYQYYRQLVQDEAADPSGLQPLPTRTLYEQLSISLAGLFLYEGLTSTKTTSRQRLPLRGEPRFYL